MEAELEPGWERIEPEQKCFGSQPKRIFTITQTSTMQVLLICYHVLLCRSLKRTFTESSPRHPARHEYGRSTGVRRLCLLETRHCSVISTQLRRIGLGSYVKPLISVNSCLISPPSDLALSLALVSSSAEAFSLSVTCSGQHYITSISQEAVSLALKRGIVRGIEVEYRVD